MSHRTRIAAACVGLTALAACDGDGSPFLRPAADNAAPPGVVTTNIPEVLAGNLSAISFNATDNTWAVTLTSLDAPDQVGIYNVTPALDIGPYQAYTIQDDSLDRFFTLLVSQSADASIRAGTVADGGQFNRYFGGIFYERTGAYDPGTGLAEYTGTYAALTNLNVPGSDPNNLTATPPAGTDPGNLPSQSVRVQGDIFFNVDFTDNTINGAITDRVLLDVGTGGSFISTLNPLNDIFLIVTDIDANGEFLGDAENPDLTAAGNYGGILGGSNSQFLGGGTFLQDFIEDIDNEEERGTFVLESCDTSGNPACP